MALVNAEKLDSTAFGFSELSLGKQITILVGIAASIAIGFMVVLWSKKPDYVPLYANLDPREASQIIDALQKHSIPNKYEAANGGVMVPVGQVDEVRMKLAAEGLPRGGSLGFELLDKPQGFGTSQFMESIRYRRGLEGELARTIGSLDAIRAARVHLGIPKETSFLKKRMPATASVMLDLNTGHELDRHQVDGIVHLVASSVPGLTKESVSIVDQRGALLTGGNRNSETVSMEQFNYSRQLESVYARRIENLLTPILGMDSVRAQVTAELDFTTIEKTEQNFDNEKPSVRSETTLSEQKLSSLDTGGVPGALSNQPPSVIGAPEQATSAEEESTAQPKIEENGGPVNKRNQSTRNFELDKSITHVKQSTGKLIKLSVAVVVNDKVSYDAKGKPTFTPLTEQEIDNIKILVKDAIGYNEERGDTVSVINSTFAQPPPVAEPPPLGILEQPWLIPVIKQVLAGLLVLIIIFSVIRPMMKNLSEFKPVLPVAPEPNVEELAKEAEKKAQLALPEPDMASKQRIEHVKQIAHEDAATTAQVVMGWVGKEED